MAVEFTEITAAQVASTANATTYASGSFTPLVNRLYLLGVVHSDAAPEATVPTVATTTGLAFVQIGSSIVFDTIASNVHRLTIFRALKTSGLGAGTYTITLGDAGTGATGILLESNNQINTTGTDGSGAIGTTWTNNGDASANPTVTIAALANNNNGIVAFFGSDDATAPTAPAGWTVHGDPNYNSPATGGFAMSRGGHSGSNTVSCTLTSSDWAAHAIEVVSTDTNTFYPSQAPNRFPVQVPGQHKVITYGHIPGKAT